MATAVKRKRVDGNDFISEADEHRRLEKSRALGAKEGEYSLGHYGSKPREEEIQKDFKCYKCGGYGHKLADKECPMYWDRGSIIDSVEFAQRQEDPMYYYCQKKEKDDDVTEKTEKLKRVDELKEMLKNLTDSDSDSNSHHKHKSKKKKEKKQKQKEKKKHRKHKKHKS